MQPVTVAPVILSAPDPHPGTRQSYNSPASKCFGATQICIGATCIILQAVAIIIHAGLYPIGHGIWCGVFFITTGSFGIVAAKAKRTGFIITFMTLSIVSASVFVAPLIAFAATGLRMDLSPYRGYYYHGGSQSKQSAAAAMNGLLIALGLLEGIIAIISSAFCCGPLCSSPREQQAVYTQGQVQFDASTGQQVVVLPVAATAGLQQQACTEGTASGQYMAPGQQPGNNPPPYCPQMMTYTGEQLPDTKV